MEHWLGQHGLAVQLTISVVAALGTMGAAFAAWMSALSTRSTVTEMRQARLQAVRPVLHLWCERPSMSIGWNHDNESPNIVFADENSDKGLPLQLTNAVESPAFDVECEWLLGGEAELPRDFRLVSFQRIEQRNNIEIEYKDGAVEYKNKDPDLSFFNWTAKYSLKAKTFHTELMGKASKALDLPDELKRQLAFWVIVGLERQQIYKTKVVRPAVPLQVKVSCSAPSGEVLSKTFNFTVSVWGGSFIQPTGEFYGPGVFPSDWIRLLVPGRLAPDTGRLSVMVDPEANPLAVINYVIRRALINAARQIVPF